jgi:hypothetical protein
VRIQVRNPESGEWITVKVADTIRLITDAGVFTLTYLTIKQLDIRAPNGTLLIEPRASNSIRIKGEDDE